MFNTVKAFISVLIFISLASNAASQSTQGFPDINAAVDYLIQKPSHETESRSFSLMIGKNLTGFSGIRREQGNNKHTVVWIQHKVTKEQLTWEKWRPASCMFSNEFSAASMSVTMSGPPETSIMQEKGFDFEFGQQAAIHSGLLISSDQNPSTDSRTYHIPPHTNGQLWSQKMVTLQSQQYRVCERKDPGGKDDIKCEAWSPDVKGAISTGKNIKYGWRTDWKTIEIDACGDGMVAERE